MRQIVRSCLRVLAVGILFVLACAPPAVLTADRVAPPAQVTASPFASLLSEYIDAYYDAHPTRARESGLHRWDGRLDDFSDAALAAEVESLRSFQARFGALAGLGATESSEREVVLSTLAARLYHLTVTQDYAIRPGVYTDILLNAYLWQQVMFKYGTAEEQVVRVAQLQEGVPRLMEQARLHLQHPAQALTVVAISDLETLRDWAAQSVPAEFHGVVSVVLEDRLQRSSRLAAQAIDDLIRDLKGKDLRQSPSFALGAAHLQSLLRYEQGITTPLPQIQQAIAAEIVRTRRAFADTAAAIDRTRPALAVWHELQRDHPTLASLMPETRRDVEALRLKTRDNALVGRHPARWVDIELIPLFMDGWYQSMWNTGPYEPQPRPGVYFVPRKFSKLSAADEEEFLREFPRKEMIVTSIHEVLGHYLQGAYLLRVPSRVATLNVFQTYSNYEGWAHYVEQVVVETLYPDDPRMRLGMLFDALLRLCRAHVALALHQGTMTVPEAAAYFRATAYAQEELAKSEAERGTYDPSYMLYAVGKLAIQKLQADYLKARGLARTIPNLAQLHHEFLMQGQVPIPLIRRRLLGAADDGVLFAVPAPAVTGS